MKTQIDDQLKQLLEFSISLGVDQGDKLNLIRMVQQQTELLINIKNYINELEVTYEENGNSCSDLIEECDL